VPPLLLKEVMGVARSELLGSTSLPEDEMELEIQT
jgi:hypothetical protein